MRDKRPANRLCTWRSRFLITSALFIVAVVPLGLLSVWLSDAAGMPPAQREETIAALIIEDETGTLRLTSLFLTVENADRRVAGEVGLTLEVARMPGPFIAARETRAWRTEYAIDPNYGERLPTGNDVWRALLARYARENGLAQGDAADYLGRADGRETRLLWVGIIANGAILGVQLLILAVIVMVIVLWIQSQAGRASSWRAT